MKKQPIDSSRLSLDEFCFCSKSVKITAKKSGKFRDLIDAFRTVYWFHSLRIGMNANTTYQLEQTLEPDAFCVDADGGSYRRNKWGAYRLGKHTPTQKLIISVNERCEGAQSEFEHVLWDALRISNSAAQNADAWIRRIDPDIQSILWSKDKKISGNRARNRQLGALHLQVIERRASLDALACLTILLREAHELGRMEQSFNIAKSLCRVLVMIGDVLNGHGISHPLYEYYEEVILPLASWQEKRFGFQGIHFMTLVGQLYHRLYHLKNVDLHRLSEQEKGLYKLKILNGEYGWDYMYLLNPIEISTKKVIDLDSKEDREQHFIDKRRQWALENILTNGGGHSLPPM